MAINIFSGSSSPKAKSNVNSASASQRAQQAKNALATSAEASASGNTAVGTKNTLQKIGGIVGKVAGVASKFLPGIGGTIAKGLSNIFNDPEWWQQIPGDALTLNEPLRATIQRSWRISGSNRYGLRASILEIPSASLNPGAVEAATSQDGYTPLVQYATSDYDQVVDVFSVIDPTEQQVTQYLMPQIRKVVNAIPLQEAARYRDALRVNATIYAAWRQFRKVDYMAKHGQTYLANMNDPGFPLLQTTNAAWLQSTINRLEEYLRANVRLPHTLCEYLAWRFGRVYKSNDSVKSALVLYDVLPLSTTPEMWDRYLNALMNFISANPETQKANTDLYNTYYDHDYMVEVRDDTQFRFDKKEFMLRLNLYGRGSEDWANINLTPGGGELVAIDSALDNPTAFMASTVSAIGAFGEEPSQLFPVSSHARIYIPDVIVANGSTTYTFSKAYMLVSTTQQEKIAKLAVPAQVTNGIANVGGVQIFGLFGFLAPISATDDVPAWAVYDLSLDRLDENRTELWQLLMDMMWAKSVDLYNFGCNLRLTNGTTSAAQAYLDISQLSIDAGSPTLTTIATEQVYAFANLVDIDRKHSMSYKQAERLVAKDTAELIDSLDVASVAPTSTSSK